MSHAGSQQVGGKRIQIPSNLMATCTFVSSSVFMLFFRWMMSSVTFSFSCICFTLLDTTVVLQGFPRPLRCITSASPSTDVNVVGKRHRAQSVHVRQPASAWRPQSAAPDAPTLRGRTSTCAPCSAPWNVEDRRSASLRRFSQCPTSVED